MDIRSLQCFRRIVLNSKVSTMTATGFLLGRVNSQSIPCRSNLVRYFTYKLSQNQTLGHNSRGSTEQQRLNPCIRGRTEKTVGPPVLTMGSVRCMAGHSKWANIRHIKAAKDDQKSRVISEFMRKMRSFVRETGQTDPKTSNQLAKMISEAKSKNVPSATVDRVLTQLVSLKNASPMMFEAKGPSGSVMLIEAISTNMVHTRAALQGVVRKCGFSLFEGGSLARMVFEEKGVVMVECQGGDKPDLDSYVEVAIEAGAEDVTLEDDEEGGPVLQFVCEPGEVYAVKKELEARQLPVRSAEVLFNVTSAVPLDSHTLELMGKAMDKLDEHPDVLKVYTNVVEAS